MNNKHVFGGYLSPFQKQKVKEIEELNKENINPLRVIISTSLGQYGFNKEDVHNFYAQEKRSFAAIVR